MDNFEANLLSALRERLKGPREEEKNLKVVLPRKRPDTWPDPDKEAPSPGEYLSRNQEAINTHLENKKELYALLIDEKSKRLLVDVTLYSLLGPAYVSFADAENIRGIAAGLVSKACMDAEPLEINEDFAESFVRYFIFKMDISKIIPRRDYRVLARPTSLFDLKFRRLYEYWGEKTRIKVEKDDYVFDCGACFGDTAVHFCHDAGEKGRVFAFEAYPKMTEIVRMNIALNPDFADRIILIEKAVSDRGGLELSFNLSGEGSSYCSDRTDLSAGTISVQTTTIDEEAAKRNLPRVDFIKMDIEGAEPDALRGAEKTLRAFKPKLAVSIYHRTEDYQSIPAYLNGLDLGYRFYLAQQSFSDADIILFATARP
ncbi:FkbM family methyltransferase [Desulfovibrio sp. OttesenSCG-928-C14]|nr:FkbM family methyltransferase [Desulfovibrio sp. OttesenSCG-928-C14]